MVVLYAVLSAHRHNIINTHLLPTHYRSFTRSRRLAQEGFSLQSLSLLVFGIILRLHHLWQELNLSRDGYPFGREPWPCGLPTDQHPPYALYTENSPITRVESTDSSQESLAKEIGPQKSSSELFSRRGWATSSVRGYASFCCSIPMEIIQGGLGECVPFELTVCQSAPRRPNATAASVTLRGRARVRRNLLNRLHHSLGPSRVRPRALGGKPTRH